MAQLDLLTWTTAATGIDAATTRHHRPGAIVTPDTPAEWKIVAVRELGDPQGWPSCHCPEAAAHYWRTCIATAPHYNADVECFAVLLLNLRHRVRGHHLISIGSLNETVVRPRETFRAAVIGAAYSVVLMHNHPSGDPTPSSADIAVTRRLVEAGKLLDIPVEDHVIVG